LILESGNGILEGLAFTLQASVTVNFRPEGTITDLPYGLVYAVVPHIVAVKESEYVSGDHGGGRVNVDHGCCVDLAVISRPIERQPPFYKRVRGVEVCADVTRRRFTAVFVSDTEWNESRASIVLEAGWDWGCNSSGGPRALRLLRVSGALSIWYRLGSVTSASTLTSTSSGTYTQPFGSDGGVDAKALCDDTRKLVCFGVGWRNRSGILVVFEGIEETTCQRCGLRTIEVNPRHAVGLNGGPHWDSRGEVKGCVWDDGGVSVAILVLFSTPSASSEIMRGGRSIGMRPALMRRCLRSSHSRLRSSSCSRFQLRACLIPSPFGRGERNSKRFSGLVSGSLTVGSEGRWGVDPKLSEHGCDIRRGGRGCDRSRNKDGSVDGKWLEGGEVDDGDGDWDTNWGVDGKLLRVRDGRVGDGSSRVFVGEVIVAIGGHVRQCVLVEVVGSSGEWGMRRLSE
jgi:hypothetical protein